MNFGDGTTMPTMTPFLGFKWQFLVGFWALVPANVNPSSTVTTFALDSKEVEDIDMHSTDNASLDHISKSNDSISKFKRYL